jgi:hypothetical protein
MEKVRAIGYYAIKIDPFLNLFLEQPTLPCHPRNPRSLSWSPSLVPFVSIIIRQSFVKKWYVNIVKKMPVPNALSDTSWSESRMPTASIVV